MNFVIIFAWGVFVVLQSFGYDLLVNDPGRVVFAAAMNGLGLSLGYAGLQRGLSQFLPGLDDQDTPDP